MRRRGRELKDRKMEGSRDGEGGREREKRV